jgi:RNA polymerase sigma factor (sigma-70 family)
MAMANGEAVAGPRGPVEDLENQELGESIRTALRAVPESRRPVVKLYLAGYSKTEIAELMGCTFDKVRNLLYRGLADLRAQLTQRGIGPRGMT